jgi:very-short-patch-repair endonuclease|tara:strand:- start:2619 stop:2963 length:345 start_codon:yes stop_codon:yes gene_type:complete
MVTEVKSDLEEIVYNWLTKRNIEFVFQSSLLGGRFSLGGAIVDFTFPDRRLAWRIQGDYFHRQIAQHASDRIQKEMLMAQGWTVVDIFGTDLETPIEVNTTLTKALEGEEVLRR